MAPADTLSPPEPPRTSPATPALAEPDAHSVQPLKDPAAFLWQLARNMFSLDHRSVALARIGVALCLLWVVYTHGSELRIFYSDEGVLPRYRIFGLQGSNTGFSLFFANGSVAYVTLLFVMEAMLAVMLLVGYRTRIAVIGCFLFTVSLANRHPVLVYGADNVLRVSLFWMMFMPLSRRFSIDSLTGRSGPPPDGPYFGIPGVAFIVQFASIYTAGALMKVGDSWLVTHDAVAYTLAIDAYTRDPGRWFLKFPALTTFLTYSTIYLETYGPLLFILPVFTRWGRLLGILAFGGLQLGFGFCMFLEYFGPVMIAITMVFLPAMVWDRLTPMGRRIGLRLREKMPRALAWLTVWWQTWVQRQQARHAIHTPLPTIARVVRFFLFVLRDTAVATLTVIMIFWNIGNIPIPHWWLPPVEKRPHYSAAMCSFIWTIGIDQQWDMFSPFPQNIDGWFVVAGSMRNGTTINLMTGESPVSYDMPASVCHTYRNRLWMGYLIGFWSRPGALDSSDPGDFAYYLLTDWNAHHSGDEQLLSVQIDQMLQDIGPGQAKSEVVRTTKFPEQ